MLGLIPTPTAQPRRVNWVISGGAVTTTLRLTAGPDLHPLVERAPVLADLAELIVAGVLEEVVITAAVVDVTLTTSCGDPRRVWATEGSAIRRAILTAISAPEQLVPSADSQDVQAEIDAELATAVKAAIAGPLAPLLLGHGGRIEVRGVHDGIVDVELGGACEGCSAAEVTLHRRLESLVRAQFPQLRGISPIDTGEGAQQRRRAWLNHRLFGGPKPTVDGGVVTA